MYFVLIMSQFSVNGFLKVIDLRNTEEEGGKKSVRLVLTQGYD